MEEPDRAGGMEGRGAAGDWSPEAKDGQRQIKGRAGGTREPSRASGLPGHGGEEGARSHGGAAGSTG